MTDQLREEHTALRREARRERRAFQRSPLGSIARQLEDAMTDYHQARSNGVSREDAVKGLELVLRDSFKAKPVYECAGCDGTGWRQTFCSHGVMRCGRYRCSLAEPAYEHAYVVPCDCPRGDRFKARAVQPEDDLVAAGKTRKAKPRGWSRLGE